VSGIFNEKEHLMCICNGHYADLMFFFSSMSSRFTFESESLSTAATRNYSYEDISENSR